MTLESILYLFLGFLIAIFLALVFIPAIWNRAAYLTEQKVRAAVPYSKSEVEAEKDILRAEHAMTVRRLEMAIEELRGRASKHVAELHGFRDSNNHLKAKSAGDDENLAKLENAGEQMREKLAVLHEKNIELSKELQSTTEKLETLNKDHSTLLSDHSNASEELSKAKIDLIASEGKIDSLSGALETLNLPDDAKAERVKKINADLADVKRQLREKTKEAKASERSIATLQKKLDKLGVSDDKTPSADIAAGNKDLEARVIELGEELMREKSRTIELEADLARLALNAEIATADRQDDNSLEHLRAESEQLNKEISDLAGKKLSAAAKTKMRKKILAMAEKATSSVGS